MTSPQLRGADWLIARWRANEQLRFVVVGGYNTVFGYLSFVTLYAFLHPRLHYLVIGVLAHAIAACNAFVAHRRLVFGPRGPWAAEFVRFNVAQLTVVAGGLAALWLLVTEAGLNPLVAQTIVTVCAVGFSYFAHRHFSFAAAVPRASVADRATLHERVAKPAVRETVAPFAMTRSEAAALVYVALPSVIFVAGWIVAPLGPLAAAAMAAAVVALLLPQRHRWAEGPGPLWLPIVALAALWCVLAGIGHLVFANSDWVVRDAVLVDLVREPWPVRYRLADLGLDVVLRAPVGYFLPAAVLGRLGGVAFASYALLAWTVVGVMLTFSMMLRDRPPLPAALIRMLVFIVFSGMDIVGTITHYNPHPVGEHLEWWASIFQYSSQTTQLFWVPNHALSGWLAIAWLLGQDPRRLPTTPAILFVLFSPLWSPLTAVGIAPIVGVALLRRAWVDRRAAWKPLFDWRLLVCFAVCMALVFPYLVAGSDTVPAGSNGSIRFVGEDIVPRTIEFLIFEVAGFAVVLLLWKPKDPLLWAALGVLVALPWYHFGPFNDLAMRGSIAALTLLAIEMGRFLSEPFVFTRHRRKAIVGVLVLGIGAVTPFMEFARIFIQPNWPMNTASTLIEVTRGAHYIASPDLPWMRRFLKSAD